ncbi:MAG TPA: hypothetical protein VFL83_20185 [Anaeromyxobacter sp.]|nr:hypothetical protein [Anaeromyxobacter sp.]
MRLRLATLAVVLAAAAGAYLPAIDGDFVLDDVYLLESPLVRDPFSHGLAEWLRSGRPLATFTFALNHLAVGLDPRGWHLTNVAVHLAAIVLAWAFARLALARAGLSRPEGPALAAAALFALHPLQAEAVAYVSQRAESLASGLYLAGLLLLCARDAAAAPRRRGALLAGATAVHALGLATKPIVATLPAAWLLVAATLPLPAEAADPAWRRVVRRLPAAAPLLALSALAAVSALAGAAGSLHAGLDIPDLPPASYAATQLRVVPTYLRLLAWPSGQCADWDFPASGGFLEPSVLAGAALLAAVAAGAVLAAVRARGRAGDPAAALRVASFGAAFFLLALAPSSSVVPLKDPLAEHRVYLAALGPLLAASASAALALRRAAGRRAAAAGVALSVALVAAATAATARRSAVWATRLALWSDAAAKAPGKARVHLNLGHALADANRPADALAEFRRARGLEGDGTVAPALVLENTVAMLLTLARIDEARAEVSEALGRAPRDAGALALLASVEYASGRDAASEAAARAALAADARHPAALRQLGLVLARKGDAAGARAALRAAAATGSPDPVLLNALGKAEEALGDLPAACAAYGRAAALAGARWTAALAARSRARLRCP